MELFPLRVTTERFCNRIEEREHLQKNIQDKRPTVLISPRRYGKSSLAHKVIADLAWPCAEIDLLTTYDDDSICQRVIDAVSKVLSQIMPVNLKTLQAVEKIIKGAKLSINYQGFELGFSKTPSLQTDRIQQMLSALEGLEQLAHQYHKPIIFFIDEFQRVAETPKGAAIQGAIRSVAQKTSTIAFVFSGSSRHLLADVFENSNLPLYMMCDKMNLERIHAQAYIPYIQEAAQLQWKTTLPLEVVQRILQLTECHSFYVNFLCTILWQSDLPPSSIEAVDAAWERCYQLELRRLGEELDKLTLNHRLLLQAIARKGAVAEPTAQAFLHEIGMSSGTVTPALKSLQNKDLIHHRNGQWCLIDPLMQYFLRH